MTSVITGFVQTGKNILGFVEHAASVSPMQLITSVMNAVRRITSQTTCDGSNRKVETWRQVDESGPYNAGPCPVCKEEVRVRYVEGEITQRNQTGIPVMQTVGKWVTLPHDKPFDSSCAECGKGIYGLDYLCGGCRAKL